MRKSNAPQGLTRANDKAFNTGANIQIFKCKHIPSMSELIVVKIINNFVDLDSNDATYQA